jgi:hypothetical protein
MGFGLVNEFIDHLHDSELQAITAPPLISTIHKSPQRSVILFPACVVFTNRSLATSSNIRDSSASRAQVLSSQPPVQRSLGLPSCLQVFGMDHVETPRFQQYLYCCASIRCCGNVLPSRCLETSLIYLPISRSSRSNGSTRYNIKKKQWFLCARHFHSHVLTHLCFMACFVHNMTTIIQFMLIIRDFWYIKS